MTCHQIPGSGNQMRAMLNAAVNAMMVFDRIVFSSSHAFIRASFSHDPYDNFDEKAASGRQFLCSDPCVRKDVAEPGRTYFLGISGLLADKCRSERARPNRTREPVSADGSKHAVA